MIHRRRNHCNRQSSSSILLHTTVLTAGPRPNGSARRSFAGECWRCCLRSLSLHSLASIEAFEERNGVVNKQALFLNGVYRSVLRGILKAQSEDPKGTFYLQPYKSQAIAKFRDNLNLRPTNANPVRLYASTTDDLSTVSFSADIVDWADKRELSQEDFDRIHNEIMSGGYNREGLFSESPETGRTSVNLLYVQDLVKLACPFPVSNLSKTSDGLPLSAKRTQSGGWSYVFKL